MKNLLLVVCGVLVFLASAVPAAGDTSAEAATRALVARYLAAYTQRDFATLRGFYGAESVFRDPTAGHRTPAAAEVELRGPEAILAFLADIHADTLDFRLDVEHDIVVGALAVVEGVAHRRTTGAGPSATATSSGRRAVWVLRLDGGLVVEHIEYNDFASPPPAAPEPVAPVPVAPVPVAPVPVAPEPVVPITAEPTVLTLEQIRTLVVVPLLTDGKLDDELTVMLAGQLREKKPRFELISERQVVAHFPDPGGFSSAADLELLLAAARRAGVQAIVLGQASAYKAQSDYGNRLRLKIVEVDRGTVVWSGGGWGTGGVSSEAAKKRSVIDAVRQIP